MTSKPSPQAGDFLPPIKTPQGQPAEVCGDGVLHLVPFTLLTRLEAFGKQRTQQLNNHPQHSRSKQDENEQEHQRESGGNKKLNHVIYLVVLDFLDAGARIELAAPDNETGMLPLHHPAGATDKDQIKPCR